jgi:hypothetical protein
MASSDFDYDEDDYSDVDRLHYYRCLHCLEVFTTYEDFPVTVEDPDGDYKRRRWMTDLLCVCAGRIQWLGQVSHDFSKLEKSVERSVCDLRCTRAHGPICYCRCNCKNHGSGLTVMVKIDAGGIPRPEFPESTAEFVVARGQNYTALLEAVTSLLRRSRQFESLASRNWHAFKRATRLMVYKKRMDSLQELYIRLSHEQLEFVLPYHAEQPKYEKPVHGPDSLVAQEIVRVRKQAAAQIKEYIYKKPEMARQQFSNLLFAAENPGTVKDKAPVKVSAAIPVPVPVSVSVDYTSDRAERLVHLENMLNDWLSVAAVE